MVNKAKKLNIKLCPHTKMHRNPYVALKKSKQKLYKITIATLEEAEVLRKRSITDIFIGFPIIRTKIISIKKLARNIDLIIALDSEAMAKRLPTIGEKFNKI